VRRRPEVGALALAAVLSGCAGHQLTPLPVPVRAAETTVQPSSAAASPTASPAASPAPSPTTSRSSRPPAGVTPDAPAITIPPRSTSRTPEPKPTTAAPPSSCDEAVLVDLDLQNTELALVPSMCFHIGGVLRLHSIGPGLVEATPEALRDYRYEAAVVTLRFLRPGTVTVTIPQDTQTYTIEVVVIS
jgi:hypothetical protein